MMDFRHRLIQKWKPLSGSHCTSNRTSRTVVQDRERWFVDGQGQKFYQSVIMSYDCETRRWQKIRIYFPKSGFYRREKKSQFRPDHRSWKGKKYEMENRSRLKICIKTNNRVINSLSHRWSIIIHCLLSYNFWGRNFYGFSILSSQISTKLSWLYGVYAIAIWHI